MQYESHEEELAVKRYILSLLARQAGTDQEIATTEGQYFAYVVKELGLDDAEVQAILKNPTGYEISPPPDESKRLTILYYLMFMMRADGQIKDQEESFCLRTGVQLGLRPELIQGLIQVMKQYAGKPIPSNAMLEVVQRYLN